VKRLEEISRRHGELRSVQGRDSDTKRFQYDLIRMLDVTFMMKHLTEVAESPDRKAMVMGERDFFQCMVVFSRYLEDGLGRKPMEEAFVMCWFHFKNLVESVLVREEALEYGQALGLARLLFFSALAFNLPPESTVENYIGNLQLRPEPGTYPASPGDLEIQQNVAI